MPSPEPFQIAYHHATAHGVLAAVHLPDGPEPVPEDILAQLDPTEAAHAATLRGFRQAEFVGGRLALRSALYQIGFPQPPILPDDRGAPSLPPGLAASISHKRTLAVAMAARSGAGTLGIDLEDISPARNGIASRVLTPAELAEVERMDESRRWLGILVRFCVKEAVYKALHPYVRRYVAFEEAEVTPDVDGGAAVTLNLAHGEGPFKIDARYEWLRGRLLATVRILPAP